MAATLRRLASARFAAVAAMLVLAACIDKTAGPSVETDPAKAVYASSLGIDIATFTKTSLGTYYKDGTIGTGRTATATDTVTIAYTLYFVNGAVIETAPPSAPFARAPLATLLTGFGDGIAGMKVGGTRRIIIPPSLAYGSTGYQGIPGNTILIFDIQLISIP